MSRTPPWYAWVIVLATVVAGVGASVMISLHASNRAVQAERQARLDTEASRRAQAQASLAVICGLIVKQETVFRSFGTQNSAIAADAWHDLGVTYRCYAK